MNWCNAIGLYLMNCATLFSYYTLYFVECIITPLPLCFYDMNLYAGYLENEIDE